MPDLPTGTVTFLFTDIEGSTRLWEEHAEAMEAALMRHDALAAAIVPQHAGRLVKQRGEGDSLFVVFAHATDAVAAATALQRALCAEPWQAETPLRVRMALHTGDAALREGDYYGAAVNRCARLRAVAHGCQVLLSQTTCDLVRDHPPAEASLRDLGSHRLKDLQQPERIFGLLHPELPTEFPPLRSLDALPNNLPRQLTSFIGREKEVREIKGLLADSALLTLTGSGGCGKTRLALQVAADLLEEYPDGVWLVELALLADPSLVPQSVASALGVREQPGRPLTATLTDHLRPKSLLLVLDNCEHLLTACAQLADALLRSCPELRMLASSREGLGIGGEQTYRAPSLSLPDARHLPPLERLQEFEAVQLFADRARLSEATFALTQGNALAVAQLCTRLDGIPLAIELAAARMKVLPVEQLVRRLDDRFRLLTGGSRTALPRQQTLRATIDWSYDLLSEPERVLLRRLSVFAGGWTLEAAEAVCGDDERPTTNRDGPGMAALAFVVRQDEVLDLLGALVDKSLVVVDKQGEEARYRLLETVRQYARDRLMETEEAAVVRERHRDWFLALGQQAEKKVFGAEAEAWLDRVESEHDNLRAALGWTRAQGEGEAGLRLGGWLWRFWHVRGYGTEGREQLAGLLALPGAEARTQARVTALMAAGILADEHGEYRAARALFEEGLAIARELQLKWAIGGLLRPLGEVARAQGDLGTARALFEESMAIERGLGSKHGMAWSLHNLGMTARDQGDYGAARALLEEGLSLFRESEDKPGIAWSYGDLGLLALDQGDYGAARGLLEESLAMHRGRGNKRGIASSLGDLGLVALGQGDYGAARGLLEESLPIFRELGHKPGIVRDLEGLAAVAVAQAQSERAARLFGAAEALREDTGFVLPLAELAEHDRSAAAARTALGEEAFAAAWAEGKGMPLDDAIRLALAI